MIISVNGNLIDTKVICAITSIEKYEYEFVIYFFGNINSVTVSLSDHKSSIKKLEEVRTKIIEIWLDNKLDVPEFNV